MLGGLYLPIYLILSIIIYHLLDRYTGWIRVCYHRNARGGYNAHFATYSIFIYTLQCVVGIPLKKHWKMNVVRFIDNSIVMAITFVFAFWKFECDGIICSDGTQRNAVFNPYVMVLVISAALGTVIQFVVFWVLSSNDIVMNYPKPKKVEIVDSEMSLWQMTNLRHHPLVCRQYREQRRERKLQQAQKSAVQNATTNQPIQKVMELRSDVVAGQERTATNQSVTAQQAPTNQEKDETQGNDANAEVGNEITTTKTDDPKLGKD